jgi:hypothetical protein
MRLAEKAGSDRLFNESPWGSGVPIFFAISGFIMVVTSANAFGSTQSALDFMRRRIIRIVPLYWLVTTVGLAALLVMPAQMKVLPNDYGYIISSYLFWPAMRLTGDVRPLATPGWTLNLEMFFYVVFAIALLFPRRFGLPFLFSSLGLLVCARVSGLLPGVALNFWGDPIVLGFLLGAAVGVIYIRGIRLSAVAAAALTIVSFTVLWQVDVATDRRAVALLVAGPDRRRRVLQSLSRARISAAADLSRLAEGGAECRLAVVLRPARRRDFAHRRARDLLLLRETGDALAQRRVAEACCALSAAAARAGARVAVRGRRGREAIARPQVRPKSNHK